MSSMRHLSRLGWPLLLLLAALFLAASCSSGGGGGGGNGSNNDGSGDDTGDDSGDDGTEEPPIRIYLFAGPDESGEDATTFGVELWRTDGTDEGTFLVQDTVDDSPYQAGQGPYDFTQVGDEYFFFVINWDVEQYQLWKSDGSEGEAALIASLGSEYDPYGMVNLDGTLYFAAADSDGLDPWMSDGTEDGTEPACGLNGDGDSDPNSFALLDGELYFYASFSETNGLFTCADGGILVKDANGDGDTEVQYLVTLGDQLYYAGIDADGDYELWTSDGTESGTDVAENISDGEHGSAPQFLTVVGEQILFLADADGDTASNAFNALYAYDGSDLTQLTSFDPGEETLAITGVQIFSPDGETAYVVIIKYDGMSGVYRIWHTDGTAEGTELYGMPGELTGGVDNPDTGLEILGESGGKLLFWYNADNDCIEELWRTDGTSEGTEQVGGVEVQLSCG